MDYESIFNNIVNGNWKDAIESITNWNDFITALEMECTIDTHDKFTMLCRLIRIKEDMGK